MYGQVEVADGGAVDQSTGDHDPACERLGDEEQAHNEIEAEFPEGDLLRDQEVEDRNGIGETSQAGEVAMNPFNVEDIFVLFQSHGGIDFDIFGCFLIFGKFLFPGLLTHRRHGAADGVPFHDGETRAGEADESSEDDEKRHDEGEDEKPVPHGAVTSLWHVMFSRCKIVGIIASGTALAALNFSEKGNEDSVLLRWHGCEGNLHCLCVADLFVLYVSEQDRMVFIGRYEEIHQPRHPWTLFVNISLINTGWIAHNEERASELRNIQKDGDIRWTVTENPNTGLTSVKRSCHCLLDPDMIPAVGVPLVVFYDGLALDGSEECNFSSNGLASKAAMMVLIRPVSATTISGSSRFFELSFFFERRAICNLRNFRQSNSCFPHDSKD